MSQIQYVDELIREYLLYRGFSGTLKMFDAELKVDKEKGFRVSLLNAIVVCSLSAILDQMQILLLGFFKFSNSSSNMCNILSLPYI